MKKNLVEKDQMLDVSEVPEATFEKADIPEPTITDCIIKIQVLSDEVRTAIEAIKALGQEVIKNNEEVMAQLGAFEGEMHIIKDAIVYGLANLTKPQQQATRQVASAAPQQTQPNITKEEIEALNWKDNQYGQWTFAYTQDGQVTQGAEKIVSALKANDNKIKGLYGRDYRLNDKFLNRSKEKRK